CRRPDAGPSPPHRSVPPRARRSRHGAAGARRTGAGRLPARGGVARGRRGHRAGGGAGEPVAPGVRRFGPILAGLCATLVGVGLQRFAYAPLLPAVVRAEWLAAGGAGTLAAANFTGYLTGAALAPTIGRALGLRRALRTAIVLAAGCFALCARPGGLVGLLPW